MVLSLRILPREQDSGWPVIKKVPVITGRNTVLEALKGERRVFRVFILKRYREKPQLKELVKLAENKGVPVEWVDEGSGRLEHLHFRQGIAAEVEEFSYTDFDNLIDDAIQSSSSLLVIVDNLEDPQNLGNILRTAEFFGAGGVIIRKKRSVQVTPVVERISQGAAGYLKIARVANLSQAIERLKEANIFVAGLDASAPLVLKPDMLELKTAIVIGGEDKGLSRLVKEKCDALFRLEGSGKVGSLNAASAFAAAAYCYILRKLS